MHNLRTWHQRTVKGMETNGDQIPKSVVFHTSFDNKGQEVCCKVSLYKNCQRDRPPLEAPV